MGYVPHPFFDIFTEEGREAERQYLRRYTKRQQIMTCIVLGSAAVFVIFMAVVLSLKGVL
jgi:hypothetical protein